MNKVLGREMAYIRKGKRLGGLSTDAGRAEIGRGIRGMAALIITSGFMGYMAMTMKDLLKGKEPRDPTKFKTIMAGFLQGGARKVLKGNYPQMIKKNFLELVEHYLMLIELVGYSHQE